MQRQFDADLLKFEKNEKQPTPKEKKPPNKKRTLLICLAVAFLLLAAPYLRVELLTVFHQKEIKGSDLAPLENVFSVGAPHLYDVKVYKYVNQKYARALFVLEDCEYGVMAILQWDSQLQNWSIEDYRCVWTVHGGSAQEFYWPMYYFDEAFL